MTSDHNLNSWFRLGVIRYLQQQGITRRELADRLHQSRSSVSRKLNGDRALTLKDAHKYAAALQVEFSLLLKLGSPAQSESPASSLRFWDPRDPDAQSGQQLLREFAQYEAAGKGITFFHRRVPAPMLTPAIQRKLNRTLVAPIAETDPDEAQLIEQLCNGFQDARRKQFEQEGSHGRSIGMMLMSDFERFVRREPPYHQVTATEVEEALVRLRDILADPNQEYEYLLLDDTLFSQRLRIRIEGTETLGIIGQGIVMKRGEDFTVAGLSEVRPAADTLTALQQIQIQSSMNSVLERLLKSSG